MEAKSFFKNSKKNFPWVLGNLDEEKCAFKIRPGKLIR